MRMHSLLARRLLAGAAVAIGCVTTAAVTLPALAADVTKARLENADAEPQNWLLGFQNYSSHRFSRLNQINRDNVKNLKVAFTISLNTGMIGRKDTAAEQHALVDDGMLYVDDGAGRFYKVDVRSGTKGTVVWRMDAVLPTDISNQTRGIAMFGNAIYQNFADGRVVSINRDSGELLWDKQIARVKGKKGSSDLNIDVEGFTASPLAVDGKILVANSKGDSGSNGWIAAVDANTGTELWRTYSVPAPGEPGNETWADNNGAWKTGGAAFWTTGSYDVGQRVTIWGSANPVPMYDPEFRPGDNLYSNSALAFDIDTGKIKWYFQYTPNESWDYDEQGVHMLIDAPFNGQDRKMVAHFGRNGFFYQLDRTNGQFLNATQFVEKVTWTAGIDPKTGKPMEYDPKLKLQVYVPATRFLRGETWAQGQPSCPSHEGGIRWQPTAYNPTTKIAYSAGVDGCSNITNLGVKALPGGGIDGAGPGGRAGAVDTHNKGANPGMRGLLSSVNVTNGKVVSRVWTKYQNLSGALATAGGLMFTGNMDGAISAHDDRTLEELWRFDTGISIKAPPISYAIGNKQYVAVVAGSPQLPRYDFWVGLENMGIGEILYVFAL